VGALQEPDGDDAAQVRRRLVATFTRRRPGISVSELRVLVEGLGVAATPAEIVADARAIGLTVALGPGDVLSLVGAAADPAPGPTSVERSAPTRRAVPPPIADPGVLVAVLVGLFLVIALVGLVLGSNSL